MRELSAEELIQRSGVSPERLRHLVELGIITPTPQGRYRGSDIQRIRVVDALTDAGFAPEQLAELITAGAYNLDWTSVVFPQPTAQVAATLEQTAPTPACRRAWPGASSTPGSCLGRSQARAPGRGGRAAPPGRAGPGGLRPRRDRPARPGSSATACGGWPSRRCACSTRTSTSG